MKYCTVILCLIGSAYALGESEKYMSGYLGNDVDKGGETSKACRYDDSPWSDCDPFELTRYRVLRLIHGGRQCEEVKNMTKHCTPGEFPSGTSWLIAEHRKCTAELTRLKAMIADLAKYIDALHGKGKTLFNSYMGLKKHLDILRNQIEDLQRNNDQQKVTIGKLREDIESWKSKARDLQSSLDELRSKYHDLEAEHKAGGERLNECRMNKARTAKENERLAKKTHGLQAENSELKRKVLDAERYKDQLKEIKYAIAKSEYKIEKLQDRLQTIRDSVEDCRMDVLSASNVDEEQIDKDTKVDLNMEMWIIHNMTSNGYKPQVYTVRPQEKKEEVIETPKCLISYYGVTNETCWYETKGDEAEVEYSHSLGHHLVEAHWKYFTISVKNQYECDKAAHLHYEFLLNRCSPKHYLPVLSIYRPDSQSNELGTHIYPKPNIPQPGQVNRCWITFLGPHGHCERQMERYSLYNSDDTEDGYKSGSSVSKTKCLARASAWTQFCQTPVIATYIPEGVSTNWKNEDIQHDSHGGKMFEDYHDVNSKINPESINPHELKRPTFKLEEDYLDTPEYRKSLHLKGAEKEELLAKLRERLGVDNRNKNINGSKDIKWHGAQQSSASSQSSKQSSSSSDSSSRSKSSSSSNISASSSSSSKHEHN